VVMPAIGETAENEDNDLYPNLGQCRALYDYAANLCDELNLTAGNTNFYYNYSSTTIDI